MINKFALSFVALSLVVGAISARGDTPAPPTISVLTAEKKPIDEQLNVTGSFAAGEMVLVLPQIEGLAITDFSAEIGDLVKKDQVLAHLNSQTIDLQIQQAMATLARNNLAVDQAKNSIDQTSVSRIKADLDLQRSKKLRTTGVETQQSLDQYQAAFDLTNAQFNGANLTLQGAKTDILGTQVQLDTLKLNKSRAEIKAPVDGYIADRQLQIGAIASGAKPPLFSIVQDSRVELLAEIPESDLPRVKVGQKASISVNGMPKLILGEVKLIAPQVNQQTRIGIAHVAVKTETRIPLGTFGRAIIILAAEEGVALPLTAVTFSDNGPTVQIVKDGKVQVRKVITGLVGTNVIEITQGVTAGETFVARAGSFVRDGDAVTPVLLTQ